MTSDIEETMAEDLAALSSADKAYNKLRKAILGNELPRQEFLSQRMLAELTETSVISVREALKKLEYEGLIESIPRWGVRIPIDTREALIERYTVREALEVMSAYLVSRHVEPEQAATLRKLAEDCDSLMSVDEEHVPEFSTRHQQLHLYLAECSGSTLIKKELERLNIQALLFQSAKRVWARQVRNWERWHRNLIEDILSGDHQRAQEAMHNHIQHGLRYNLKVFE
jgi:DNA-binding GntR family transcriptional regulator